MAIAGAAAAALRAARLLVPPLGTPGQYKGAAGGKVGVVGGCAEYTGAPYFAGMSALRAGADLAHVFCAEEAAAAIKAYSPELIVHPALATRFDGKASSAGAVRESVPVRTREALDAWVPRMDCLVIGPGLGRDPAMLAGARHALLAARSSGVPVVVDADALVLVASEPALLQAGGVAGSGGPPVVLTPNANELGRLVSALAPASDAARRAAETGAKPAPRDGAQAVAAVLAGPVVLAKGAEDVAMMLGSGGAGAESRFVACDEPGAPRRCGGQGDVLAGTLATFLAWAHRGQGGASGPGDDHESDVDVVALPPQLAAAYGACLITRRAARAAFAKRKRSMIAGDLIEELGGVVDAFAPC